MTETTKAFFKILLAMAAIGGLALAAGYAAGASLCPVYGIVGIPCPSCGMTRAWFAALRGDLRPAFAMHPLFWAAALIPFIAAFISGGKRAARPAKYAAALLVVALLVVWGIRMLIFFPHTAPMTPNAQAPVFRAVGGAVNGGGG